MKDRVFLAAVLICVALVLAVIGQSVAGTLIMSHGGVEPTPPLPISTPSRVVVPTTTPGGPTATPIPVFGQVSAIDHG
jgi:hypothetical protein